MSTLPKSIADHVMDELENIDLRLHETGFIIMKNIPDFSDDLASIATGLQKLSYRLRMLSEYVGKSTTTTTDDNTNQNPYEMNNINPGYWTVTDNSAVFHKSITKSVCDKFTPHVFDTRLSTEKRK